MFFLRVFHLGEPLPLSDLIPVLEHMGVRTIGENPYRIGNPIRAVSIHDLELCFGRPIDIAAIGARFEETFVRVWSGAADDDSFNRLVLLAQLDWREVAMLRAYAAYMKQTQFGFSQEFISDTLAKHPQITQQLVKLFVERFEPDGAADTQGAARADHRVARSSGTVERGPHPAARSRFDRSNPAHELLPTRCRWRAETADRAQARAAVAAEHSAAGAAARNPRAIRRVSKACICARDRSRAAGCGGRIVPKTIAPRCSASSKRKPSRTRSSCQRAQKAAFSCGVRPRRVTR